MNILDSLDPDNLNLEKKDLIKFCYKCIDEWKSKQNWKFQIYFGNGINC